MPKLSEYLPNGNPNPRGNPLEIKRRLDGLSTVKLDNGIAHTLTIMCHTETLGDLLDSDLKGIVAHLHSREPGHFRKKKANGN